MSEYEEKNTYNEQFPFNALYSNKPKRMNAHKHRQIEFMFFYETDGCEYVCNNKHIQVRKNDLIVSNPGEVHECDDFGQCTVCCIVAEPKMLGEFGYLIFDNLVRNDKRIINIFEKLRTAFGKKTFNLICAGCIYDIFSVLTESHSDDFEKGGPSHLYKSVKDSLIYIENNLADNLRTDILAEVSHMSVSRFHHVFKDITGTTPSEYIEKARISRAMSLLSSTDAEICEIAFNCGFSDHSYFSQRFKKRMGITPADYRKSASALRFEE